MPFLLLTLAALLAAPAAQATRAAPTVPLHRLIVHQDYPAAAPAAREQGLVEVALDVAPEGRVTGCTVVASSRSAILDATTCRILRSRARFTPARDAAGKAVADRFLTRIDWRIPPAPQVPPALHAAMSEWTNCIGPILAAGAHDLSRTPRQVAEFAFIPCMAAEDRMLAAIAGATDGKTPIEQERRTWREQVVARIEAARNRKP